MRCNGNKSLYTCLGRIRFSFLSPENIVFILKKAEDTTILIQSTKGENKRIFRRLSSEGQLKGRIQN
jgi:hypothetical protein